MFGLSKRFLVTFGFAAALFVGFAEIDIWFSGLFFDPDNNFYFDNSIIVNFIYSSAEVFAVMWVVILFCFLFVSWRIKKSILTFTPKKIIYLLLVLALGPGLTVNVIFKDHWGRPRPSKIKQFGGANEFVPAFVISDACDRNCSFVSGHASIGFYLVSIALLIQYHRKKIFTAAVSYGSLIGLARMAQGDHFLSDVVFSFFFVYCVAKLLYYFMFER